MHRQNAIYLRVIWTGRSENPVTENAIDTLFHASRFDLKSRPTRHPRGGYRIIVKCTTEELEEVLNFLTENNWTAAF